MLDTIEAWYSHICSTFRHLLSHEHNLMKPFKCQSLYHRYMYVYFHLLYFKDNNVNLSHQDNFREEIGGEGVKLPQGRRPQCRIINCRCKRSQSCRDVCTWVLPPLITSSVTHSHHRCNHVCITLQSMVHWSQGYRLWEACIVYSGAINR